MKIIEALKKIKDLQRKADDYRKKIKRYCADLELETPEYGDEKTQRSQVSAWLQGHSDIIKEIESLRIAIQKTNLETIVEVEVEEGKRVKKSIAAWIHRRKDLAALEGHAWEQLTNRGLKPHPYQGKEDFEEVKIANIRKYYNQADRDKKVEIYSSEPSLIDAALEIKNATTDLVE